MKGDSPVAVFYGSFHLSIFFLFFLSPSKLLLFYDISSFVTVCSHNLCCMSLQRLIFFFYCVLSVPSTLQRRNWAGWWHSRLDFDITTPRKQHLDIWDDWVRGIKDPRMSGYQIKVQGCVPEPWALFMHCLKWECQSEVKLHEDETIIL